jgi:outer membrane lipoprotein SlyB
MIELVAVLLWFGLLVTLPLVAVGVGIGWLVAGAIGALIGGLAGLSVQMLVEA